MAGCNTNPNYNINNLITVSASTVMIDCIDITTNSIQPCDVNDPIRIYNDNIVISSNTISLGVDVIPSQDDLINLGIPTRRFRNINSLSGSSTFWSSEIISATTVNLGIDSDGIGRILTANSSLLRNDTLSGGTY